MITYLLIQLSTVIETMDGEKGIVRRIMVDSGNSFDETVKAVSEKVSHSYHIPLEEVLLASDGGCVKIYGKHDHVIEAIGTVKEMTL